MDFNDSLLDELKKQYPDFKEWWTKISREGRTAWIYRREDDSLGALLILKTENEAIPADPPIPARPRLKICTLIVSYTGRKIGELFIRIATEHCIRNSIHEMYLTHFTEKNDILVELITDYGFLKAAEISRQGRTEAVYLKHLIPLKSVNCTEPQGTSRRYYPSFCSNKQVRKFIVPIRPEFHEKLFVGRHREQTLLKEHMGEFVIPG
ncbi:MAG: hypothetical protein KGY80_11445, partial [Candidatus Thorarchaeota archaeon]|nr:hypothetical protein [Candidatus Thorarchaeota archaeon]